MAGLLVALRFHLHVGDAGGTAWTPGHDIVPLIDQAPLVTPLEKRPDCIVVLVRKRVVVIAPIHPVTQADGLLGLAFRKGVDLLFTTLDELIYAIGFDIELSFKAKFLFNFDFNPQALAIEAVLVALLVPLHGLKALVQVLVGASPGMMN